MFRFGAPSHRLEAQIQATARVLEMPHCAAMYIPSCLLINFGDPATATSDIRFLKQATGLDIGRLKSTYWIYNKVGWRSRAVFVTLFSCTVD